MLTSPRARARETAALAGLEAEVDEDLVEFDYGSYEGRTTPEIREERPGWSVWADGAPGRRDGRRRSAPAPTASIERALAAGGDVALFAHGHLLRVLAARWIGLPATYGGHLALDTGSVSELGFERERRAIWLWNDTSHLPSVRPGSR